MVRWVVKIASLAATLKAPVQRAVHVTLAITKEVQPRYRASTAPEVIFLWVLLRSARIVPAAKLNQTLGRFHASTVILVTTLQLQPRAAMAALQANRNPYPDSRRVSTVIPVTTP